MYGGEALYMQPMEREPVELSTGEDRAASGQLQLRAAAGLKGRPFWGASENPCLIYLEFIVRLCVFSLISRAGFYRRWTTADVVFTGLDTCRS